MLLLLLRSHGLLQLTSQQGEEEAKLTTYTDAQTWTPTDTFDTQGLPVPSQGQAR